MIVCVGGTNVDYIIHNYRLPVPGETIYGKNVTIMAGGKEANQAAAAARLGSEVVYLSKLGELDAYNTVLMKDFEWAGIDTSYLEMVPDVYTGHGYVMVGDDSQNCIIILEGANKEISVEYVSKYADKFDGASLAMVEFEIPQETVEYVMKLGKEKGCTTLCNPAPYRPVDESFWQYVDIVTPNEVEAAEACGFPVVDEESAGKCADFFHAKGVKYVVITMGKMGAFCSDGERKEMIPSYPVKAIDSSGAGDSFNGAFAYAFDRGNDIFECARFANAYASVQVQHVGTLKAMPTLDMVEGTYKLAK